MEEEAHEEAKEEEEEDEVKFSLHYSTMTETNFIVIISMSI